MTDDDTVVFTANGERVRLQAIDAPESKQLCDDAAGQAYRCGQRAALALDAMIVDRPVRCESAPGEVRDRYGRLLGFCRAGDADLNLAMVRDGHALAFRRYVRGKA